MTHLALILGVFACAGPTASAQTTRPPVASVELASGRIFRGVVDPRTDSRQLWIRSGYGQAVVLRPVVWERVVSVRVAGEVHGGTAFMALAERLKLLTPGQPWTSDFKPPLTVERFHPLPPHTLRSLKASACITNWDAHAAADGLTLTIAPLDDWGALVAVEGTVEATLYGYNRRSGLPAEHWSQLAHWSQPITIHCYGPEGGVLRLSWAACSEWEQAQSPGCRLRVCLHAPGHGSFATEIPFQSRHESVR
jgi:hypothetical protein